MVGSMKQPSPISETSLLRSLALIHSKGHSPVLSRRHSSDEQAANLDVPLYPSPLGLDKRQRRSSRRLTVNFPVPDLPFMPDAAPALISSTDDNSSNVQVSKLPSSNVKMAQNQEVEASRGHLGFRKDYMLGDAAKSSRHMIIESSIQDASNEVTSLKSFDFAFVRRRDGTWTYAILACRSLEWMMFVLNDRGTTKTIQKRHWKSFIRCVAVADGDCSMSNKQRMVPKQISVQKDCDECSMLSFDM